MPLPDMKPLIPPVAWLFTSRHPATVERDLPSGIKVVNSLLNAAVWAISTWALTAWIYNTFLE
jgi:hypothetical protein